MIIFANPAGQYIGTDGPRLHHAYVANDFDPSRNNLVVNPHVAIDAAAEGAQAFAAGRTSTNWQVTSTGAIQYQPQGQDWQTCGSSNDGKVLLPKDQFQPIQHGLAGDLAAAGKIDVVCGPHGRRGLDDAQVSYLRGLDPTAMHATEQVAPTIAPTAEQTRTAVTAGLAGGPSPFAMAAEQGIARENPFDLGPVGPAPTNPFDLPEPPAIPAPVQDQPAITGPVLH